jgi:hypothetical protein
MKVKLTEAGKKIADECEIPRRVRTKFDAVMDNKEREDLPIKGPGGQRCKNCDDDVEKRPDVCVGCRYDW